MNISFGTTMMDNVGWKLLVLGFWLPGDEDWLHRIAMARKNPAYFQLCCMLQGTLHHQRSERSKRLIALFGLMYDKHQGKCSCPNSGHADPRKTSMSLKSKMLPSILQTKKNFEINSHFVATKSLPFFVFFWTSLPRFIRESVGGTTKTQPEFNWVIRDCLLSLRDEGWTCQAWDCRVMGWAGADG